MYDDDDEILKKNLDILRGNSATKSPLEKKLEIEAKRVEQMQVKEERMHKKIQNTPPREGDEDALDSKEINLNVVKSDNITLDFDNEQDNKEEYENMLLEGKKLSFLSRFLWGFFLSVSSILGIFLVSNVVSFFSSLSTLEPILKYFFIGLMLLFAGIICVLFFKLFSSLRKFSKACDFDLSKINSLAERDKFKKDANLDYTSIKDYLLTNLVKYNSDSFPKMGIAKEDINVVLDFKTELLELSKTSITSADWIAKYKDMFESKLQQLSKKRIGQYARQVGFSSAISPFAILDKMIVVSATLAMIKDVFEIYNLKLNNFDTLKLFALAITNTYFSGIAQNASEALSDSFFESFGDSEFMTQMGVGAVAGKFIAPKMTEGLINGFLIWRLGKFILKNLNIK